MARGLEHLVLSADEFVLNADGRRQHGAVFKHRLITDLVGRDQAEAFRDAALLVEVRRARRGELRADLRRDDDQVIAIPRGD